MLMAYQPRGRLVPVSANTSSAQALLLLLHHCVAGIVRANRTLNSSAPQNTVMGLVTRDRPANSRVYTLNRVHDKFFFPFNEKL